MNGPELVGSVVVLWGSVILHEQAHGYAAGWVGDRTAREAGRLGWNFLRNLDPVGGLLAPLVSILLVWFPLGYGRPVPVDGSLLRNRRRGMTVVSLAGPVLSFGLAAVFAGLVRGTFLLHGHGWLDAIEPGVLLTVLQYGVVFNLLWGGLNLLPIPPLDGFQLLTGWLPARLNDTLQRLSVPGTIVLIGGFLMYPHQLLEFCLSVLTPLYQVLVGGSLMVPYLG